MASRRKVLVGFSGGVDSSIAAFLLLRQGYEVVGAFMKNYSDSKNAFTGECFWRDEWRMAQRMAARLGIDLIFVDSEREYKKKVVDSMFRDYSRGLTPNPDILCNRVIKFPFLWKYARKIGADLIATGHYARVKKSGRYFDLLMGSDEKKDQSYFLYQLSQDDLSHLLFPIGTLTKEQVREIAKKEGFPNWNRKSTRGICFIGKQDMKEFLKSRIKERKGKVVLPSGEVVGTHPGIMFFTIGERVGEGHGVIVEKKVRNIFGSKFYVAEKRKNNVLVIAPAGHPFLKRKEVIVKNFHFVNPSLRRCKFCLCRIRHLGKFISGKISHEGEFTKFVFFESVEGVAEGQALVAYSGEKVVGGGEIRFS